MGDALHVVLPVIIGADAAYGREPPRLEEGDMSNLLPTSREQPSWESLSGAWQTLSQSCPACTTNTSGYDFRKGQGTTIPIIFLTQLGDPVDLMTSPGGNATGLRLLGDTALVDTQFWLLSKVVPRVSRIGLLQNPLNPNFAATLQSALKAAEMNGLVVAVPVEACDRREIETAFRTLIRERVQAVKVSASGRFFLERALIAAVALEHRLPTCFLYREHVEAGGLMSYGESLSDLYRRAATVADKLFKGAKPGDLPLDYPRRLHMTINRKTAVALGLTIPSQTYMLVDEMIE